MDPATRSTLTLTPTPKITPDLTQTFLGYSKTVTKTVTATITGSVTKTYTPTWTQNDDGGAGPPTTTISSFGNVASGAGGTFQSLEIFGSLGANSGNGYFAFAAADLPLAGPSAASYKKIQFYLKGFVPIFFPPYMDFYLRLEMDDGDAVEVLFVDNCFAGDVVKTLAGASWTLVTVDLESAALDILGGPCVVVSDGVRNRELR